ncbi:MAG: RnfABCDGE type electron transport complex subunit A [Turicibacter sp.]|nr:RnfABCDGE type electron transport complex subunit A [Turicibacter sp.]
MTELFLIFMGAVFVNNLILTQFLGVCPFMGVSRKVETSVGMGAAVIFVMTLAAAASFVILNLVLIPLDIVYLYNLAFIMLIASLVQFVEIYLKKASPSLYQSLGVFLPLITTNCAILGVVIINMDRFNDSFISAIVHAIGGGVGFAIAIVLLASIREKIEHNNIPAPFKGMPISLIAAGILAIAFMGFAGLI